jgi:hypothetical protein
MALYTEALCTGATIQNRLVKKATVDLYLKAATAVCTDQKCRNPTIDPITGQTFDLITSALTELEKWEGLPKRREPLTKSMIRNLLTRTADLRPNGLEKAMADWWIVGLHTGYRRSEWAQEKTPSTNEDIERADDPQRSIKAITQADINFVSIDNQKITQPLKVPISSIGGVKICWRVQKNGQNGEIVTFAANHDEPGLCIVRALLRILARALHLTQPADLPLAIYQKFPNSIRGSYIVSSQINRLLKTTAALVYNLEPDEVNLYTTHSIRVGACVLLHVAGKSEMDIKFRLRWRSNSFMMYLRNVPQLAMAQIQAINTTNVDSFLTTRP